jgi:pimeloyl-ACP methyl ester carboxylesterase
MTEIYKSDAGRRAVLERYDAILEQWPVASSHHRIETRHGTTFVIESGQTENPPVALLHGSVSNSFAWFGDVERLSASHRVLAVDLIGEAGFSTPNRPSYDSGAYAEWLNDLANALDLPAFAIVGLSLGGWMALTYATTHPDRISRLSLLCPGGVVRESRSFLCKAIFYMLLGKWGQERIVKLVNGGQLPSSEGLEDAFEFMNLIGEHFKPRTAKLPIFTNADLARLTMPVQVICGENDALIPPQGTLERLTSLAPNVQATLLPETGHVVTGQTERILEFLEAC